MSDQPENPEPQIPEPEKPMPAPVPEKPQPVPEPEKPEPPKPLPEPETAQILVPSEYIQALDRVIALATVELVVFDRNLKDGGWGSIARNDVLRWFLLKRTSTRLQIVVHETRFIEGKLPRLILLLRDFGHKLSILRTVDDARIISDAFLVADARHLVHRFHHDHFRGEMALQTPVRARQLRDRFDSIIPFTEAGVNATLTGL